MPPRRRSSALVARSREVTGEKRQGLPSAARRGSIGRQETGAWFLQAVDGDDDSVTCARFVQAVLGAQGAGVGGQEVSTWLACLRG